MRARATKHIKGNLWLWTGGFAAAGAAAVALGWGTIGAFLLMVTGLLIIMADAHVDPLAIITEDVLHRGSRDRPASWNRERLAGDVRSARAARCFTHVVLRRSSAYCSRPWPCAWHGLQAATPSRQARPISN